MSKEKNLLFAEYVEKTGRYQVWYELECSENDPTGYGPYEEYRIIENAERRSVDRVLVKFRVKRVHVTSYKELAQVKKLARDCNCDFKVVEGRY